MMIPTEVTMVPSFILFSKLGLNGTYVPLYIQSFFGRPLYDLPSSQFFMNLPHDLEDAARHRRRKRADDLRQGRPAAGGAGGAYGGAVPVMYS
jgi:hypothetical protein